MVRQEKSQDSSYLQLNASNRSSDGEKQTPYALKRMRKDTEHTQKWRQRVKHAMKKQNEASSDHTDSFAQDELRNDSFVPCAYESSATDKENETQSTAASSPEDTPALATSADTTEVTVLHPNAEDSGDTATSGVHDIHRRLAAKENSQEHLYSPQEKEYLDFLRDLEKASASPQQEQKDFAEWIRDLEGKFEEHALNPRQLFPRSDSPVSESSARRVAFSKDNTIRFFSRTKEELQQLRRKRKNKSTSTCDDDWDFFRYWDEKLKLLEDSGAWKNSIGVVSDLLDAQKVLSPMMCVSACHEGNDPGQDAAREAPSLVDLLFEQDDDEKPAKPETNKTAAIKTPSPQSGKVESSQSTSNNSSRISGLWFAVPYKATESFDEVDFIHEKDPKVTSPPNVNASLLTNTGVAANDSMLSVGNNSTQSSVSLDKKMQMVKGARRWAASQKSPDRSNASAPSPDRSNASKSPDRSNASEPDLNKTPKSDSAQQEKVVDAAKEIRKPPTPEDGPDLDESRDWSEAPEGTSVVSASQESQDWEVAEFGPDLDESRKWFDCDPEPDLLDDSSDSGAKEGWNEFSSQSEAVLQSSADVVVEEWVDFPRETSTGKPLKFQYAPDLDESKDQKASQQKDTSKTTSSQQASAPKQSPPPAERKSSLSRVKAMARTKRTNRVQEMARAIERRPPARVENVSPLSLSPSDTPWVDDGKVTPDVMGELQFPVLEYEHQADRRSPAYPKRSPVSVTNL